ncbi:hypothetical protein BJ912DRAFT_851416 [Pholiota molesta]|nr:hypothetical protein BJ912DRAFT_851416 [Pholiota molesta]
MCYREVHCTKHACGHEHPQSETRVDCESSDCRYSRVHTAGCPPKTCPETCKQWLKPARTVVTGTSPSRCGHCK